MAETNKELENKSTSTNTTSTEGTESELDKFIREIRELESQAQAYRQIPTYESTPGESISDEVKRKLKTVSETAQLLSAEESLWKMLSGTDDPTKLFILYMIWSDMKDKSLMRMYMMNERDSETKRLVETLIKRLEAIERRLEEKERETQINALMKRIEELGRRIEELARPRRPEDEIKSYIDSRISELKEIIMEKAPKEERSELLEAINGLRDAILEMKEDKFEKYMNKLTEVVEKVAEKRGTEEDINKVLDLIAKMKELEDKLFGRRTTSTPSPSVTTYNPLEYEGRAPWWMHPDARSSVKDLINTLFENIREALEIAFSYMKGGVPTPRIDVGKAQTQTRTLDEDLPKIE